MGALPYLVIYILPVTYVLGLLGGGAWPLLVPVVVFIGIPTFDQLLGHDTHDPDDDEVDARAANPLYDGLLRLWVPLQLGLIGTGLATAASGAPLSDVLWLALACGILTGGGGINIAHELMHRADRRDKALSEVLMASVTYPWFCVEHVLGHHRQVGTPADPATSRLGESVYAFLPRTLVGGLRSAWRLESERVARRGIRPGSLRDRRLRYGLELVVVYGALAWLGPVAVLFFAVQSVVAIVLLEVINYVEHYGLTRQQLPTGRYERVQPHHSWNSTHRLTGWFLFNLPRHADHHAWASRPYWQLRSWPDAPAMPFGYATMILFALVPPVWRAIMDPRVDAVASSSPATTAPAPMA